MSKYFSNEIRFLVKYFTDKIYFQINADKLWNKKIFPEFFRSNHVIFRQKNITFIFSLNIEKNNQFSHAIITRDQHWKLTLKVQRTWYDDNDRTVLRISVRHKNLLLIWLLPYSYCLNVLFDRQLDKNKNNDKEIILEQNEFVLIKRQFSDDRCNTLTIFLLYKSDFTVQVKQGMNHVDLRWAKTVMMMIIIYNITMARVCTHTCMILYIMCIIYRSYNNYSY